MKLRSVTCALVALVLLNADDLHAGQITGVSWFSGVASVAGTSFSPPVDPNNDDVSGTSPNEVFVTQKDYTGIGPVDLVFDVLDSGGVTEYFFREGVQNSTGIDWSGYHLELGFGVGGSFVKSTAGDGLDFDAPDYNSDFDFNPSPGFFTTVDVTDEDVIASDGTHANGMFAGYHRFHIDVPDGITSFTLRQSPLPVPEPGSGALVAFGLGLLARARRRPM